MPAPPTSAATRLVCLLGAPVAHSISPQVHSAAFASAGVDARYLAFHVEPADLATAVNGLRVLRFLGANLTVPHKETGLRLADKATEEALAVGAANTLFVDDGALVADNTDAVGLGDVLDDEVDLHPGDVVVLFGAGGAARAAAVALGRRGAAVDVVSRRPEVAAEVAALARSQGAASPAGASPGALPRQPRMVVNATPLGLHGESLPAPLTDLGPGQTALDLVYGRADTPFLAAARARGAQALDGRGMLVAQAARAFSRWTGVPAPRAAMVAAAEVALRS